LIVDDNRLFREGLRRILYSQNFSVASEAQSFQEALRHLRSDGGAVDLVLGDPGLDVDREYGAVRAIRQQFPDVKIVILTERPTQPWSDLALKCGAVGFLSQDIATDALKQSLSLVLTGELIISTAVLHGPNAAPIPLHSNADDAAADILESERSYEPLEPGDGVESAPRALPTVSCMNADATDDEMLATLSGREKQILDCLVRGWPNKLIARQLDVAEGTVKVHLKALLRKLSAKNRTQAAIWALTRREAAAGSTRFETPPQVEARPLVTEMVRQKRGALLDRQNSGFQERMSEMVGRARPTGPANDLTDTAIGGRISLS
jgi:two-component system nitrate/nitrite response regulator NarL